jgi:hypothetical protein
MELIWFAAFPYRSRRFAAILIYKLEFHWGVSGDLKYGAVGCTFPQGVQIVHVRLAGVVFCAFACPS